MVGNGERFGFEAHCAVFEAAEPVAVELVDFAGEYGFVGDVFPFPAVAEEVCVELYVGAFQQSVDKAVVASDGDALTGVVEVVVVEG